MPDGFSPVGDGAMQVRELPGGSALEALYRLGFAGREPYEEYELWGYDHRERKIHVCCVNSRYAVIAFSGEWKDKAAMMLMGEDTEERSRVRQEFTFTWRSRDEVRARQVTTVDGNEEAVSEFVMTRRSGS